jgi:hypothetical protein
MSITSGTEIQLIEAFGQIVSTHSELTGVMVAFVGSVREKPPVRLVTIGTGITSGAPFHIGIRVEPALLGFGRKDTVIVAPAQTTEPLSTTVPVIVPDVPTVANGVIGSLKAVTL